MKSKNIVFGLDALAEVKKGVDLLADAVKVTFGPKGNTVVIYEDNYPKVTKDGVTVARAINSPEPLYDVGVQLVKEAAAKTADMAGDGTTTSTIIAQALINLIYQQLVAGADAKSLRAELEKSNEVAREVIKSLATKVGDTPDSIKHIATISANGDEFIGTLIADVISKIGYDGVITLEESNGFDTYAETVEGMKINKGYISPYFINDPANRAAVLNNPRVLIYNGILNNVKELFSILECIVQDNEEILLIANDYSPEVINAIVRNVQRGLLKIAAIRTPGVGEYKKDLLEDISAITGSQVYDKFPDPNEDLHLGVVKKVVVTSEETTIIGSTESNKAITKRVKMLKESLKNDYPKYLIDDIKARIAKLSGGVAVIYVGAPTEIEMSEKKDRIEDAVCATRAAIEEGVVVGAGIIQEDIAKALDKKGYHILAKALMVCRKLILDTLPIYYEDALEANVLDPAKVTRVSIENALSVAYMFLSTKCVIVNESEASNSLY